MFDKFLNFIEGKLPNSDREEFFKQLFEKSASPEGEKIKLAEEAFLYTQLIQNTDDNEIGEASFNSFKGQMRERKRYFMPHNWYKHVAIYVLMMSVGGMISWWLPSEEKEMAIAYNEIEVPIGQRSRLTLSDGTVVWLHSNSKLSYPTVFGSNQRNVNLEGEAYFEVSKDARKPFIVALPQQTIKVLGTEFNVSAYPDQATAISLLEGSVEVSNGNDASIIMTPRHRVVFDNHTMHYDTLINHDFLLWKEGIYVFDKSSFEEITMQLENYYGIRSVFLKEELKSYRFTGKFRQQDGIENIMNLLKESRPFNYRRNDLKNEIYIY